MKKDSVSIGDVVRLASGGPAMTVTAMHDATEMSPRRVSCVWFSGGDLKGGVLDARTVAPLRARRRT